MRRPPKVDAVRRSCTCTYLHGLSTGDFQEALPVLLGDDAAGLSPSAITRPTHVWREEYAAWKMRSLAARERTLGPTTIVATRLAPCIGARRGNRGRRSMREARRHRAWPPRPVAPTADLPFDLICRWSGARIPCAGFASPNDYSGNNCSRRTANTQGRGHPHGTRDAVALDQSDREVDEMMLLDLGWSAPALPVDAGAACRSILQQHEWIRVVLGRGSAVAEARLDGVASGDSVAAAIGELRSAMIAHLAFEEAALLPLLRDDLPLGPQRADRLLDEHARQRDMLDKIFEEARAQPDLHTLASKLAFLTEWLYADMLEEERSLLNPAVVRDDPIVIGQTCG
jgi:hypothetical protein